MSEVHVRVRAGGEDYALPVDGVLEVTELGEIAAVPGSSEDLLGVRNLRGQVVPVADLARLFGISAVADRERIVVSERAGVRAGLAVESVVDVGALPPPSEAAESEYLVGATLVDGQLVGIVDLDRLLGALVTKGAA